MSTLMKSVVDLATARFTNLSTARNVMLLYAKPVDISMTKMTTSSAFNAPWNSKQLKKMTMRFYEGKEL